MPTRSVRSTLALFLAGMLLRVVAAPATAAIPAPITVSSLGGAVADDGVW